LRNSTEPFFRLLSVLFWNFFDFLARSPLG